MNGPPGDKPKQERLARGTSGPQGQPALSEQAIDSFFERPFASTSTASSGHKTRQAASASERDQNLGAASTGHNTRQSGSRSKRQPVEIDPTSAEKIVLIWPGSGVPGSVAITHGDTKRLDDGEFLNDTLIEYGLKKSFATVRDAAPTNILMINVASRTHLYNSFFYKKISVKRRKDVDWYGTVRKWTNKVDIFSKDFLIVPINEHMHWYLAIVVNPAALLRAQKDYEARQARKAEEGAAAAAAPEVLDRTSTPAINVDEDEAEPEQVEGFAQPQADIDQDEAESSSENEALRRELKDSKMGEDEGQARRVLGVFGAAALSGTRALSTTADGSDDEALEEDQLERDVVDEVEVPAGEGGALVEGAMAELAAPTPAPAEQRSLLQGRADNKKCQVFLFDSLGGDHSAVHKKIRDYLVEEAKDKNKGIIEPKVAEKFVVTYKAEVPQQDNYSDCGLYLVHYVERFLADPVQALNVIEHSDSASAFWKENEAKEKRRVMREEVLDKSKEWTKENGPRMEAKEKKKRDDKAAKEKETAEKEQEQKIAVVPAKRKAPKSPKGKGKGKGKGQAEEGPIVLSSDDDTDEDGDGNDSADASDCGNKRLGEGELVVEMEQELVVEMEKEYVVEMEKELVDETEEEQLSHDDRELLLLATSKGKRKHRDKTLYAPPVKKRLRKGGQGRLEETLFGDGVVLKETLPMNEFIVGDDEWKKVQKRWPALRAMAAEMAQEVVDTFGDGRDYTLAEKEEENGEKGIEQLLEHSVLASHLMLEEDDHIRDLDLPERLQLSSIGLAPPVLGPDGVEGFLTEGEVEDMTEWACPRISVRSSKLFLQEEEGEEREKFTTAVRNTIKFLNIDFLEPPFIWAQRSDYLLHEDTGLAYLTKEEIWKLSTMSGKFRALVQRGKEVQGWWKEVRAASEEAAAAAGGGAEGEEGEKEDKEQEGEITSDDIDYFDDFALEMDAVEDVADLRAWMDVVFPLSTSAVREARWQAEVQAAEEAGLPSPPARRKIGAESKYAMAKSTQVREMAEKVGIKARELGQAFGEGDATAAVEVVDPEETPAEMAERHVREDEYRSVPAVLEAVRVICSHEIAADPKVRKRARTYFKSFAEVSVHPTEKGRLEVTEEREDFGFKYLERKPVRELVGYNPGDEEAGGNAQFLRILAAEEAGEVKVEIWLSKEALLDLLKALKDPYCGSEQGGWRKFREEIVEKAVEETLWPMCAAWVREYIRREIVEAVGVACGDALKKKANRMPFYRQDGTMAAGDVPTVLALSHGHGDARQDSVRAVLLDASGTVQDLGTLGNLGEKEDEEAFAEALKKSLKQLNPQAIVLGGWTANTAQLMKNVKDVAKSVRGELLSAWQDKKKKEEHGRRNAKRNAASDLQLSFADKKAQVTFHCFFVEDKVARLYMNSERAKAEYKELDTLGRYCVALARFAQSPLNEFAAMGKDLVSIPFDPNQKFDEKLPDEVLLQYLERAIVDLVNKVGVDVNRATRDPYYYHLLPFVCGLGPRKAKAVRIKIHRPDVGGSLVSRDQLKSLVSRSVWINCAGFLRIPQEEDAGDLGDEEGGGDPLDSTRVHPEDYDVARLMAADALGLDEEDVAGMAHPSDPVKMLLKDHRGKLNKLSLEEFAQKLPGLPDDRKRLALQNIRTEMKKPFYEQREPFTFPNSIDLFYQLSGETPKFLRVGLNISCRMARLSKKKKTMYVKLDSGLEGQMETSQWPGDTPSAGSPLRVVVSEIVWDKSKVKLLPVSRDLVDGDGQVRHTPRDRYWSTEREEADRKAIEDAQRMGKTRQRRQIHHPNFENVTAREAENKLRNGQRGDCIVRPSSKEDHLAVTWKVDEGVFQHIAVLEVEKPDGHGMGRVLRIGRDFSYEDIDHLIANHIRALARRVDELAKHEKYKGTKEELDSSLIASTMADPLNSYYGFTINRESGASFLLGFKVDLSAPIQYSIVTLRPGGFVLDGRAHTDTTALCNAFKDSKSSSRSPATADNVMRPSPSPSPSSHRHQDRRERDHASAGDHDMEQDGDGHRSHRSRGGDDERDRSLPRRHRDDDRYHRSSRDHRERDGRGHRSHRSRGGDDERAWSRRHRVDDRYSRSSRDSRRDHRDHYSSSRRDRDRHSDDHSRRDRDYRDREPRGRMDRIEPTTPTCPARSSHRSQREASPSSVAMHGDDTPPAPPASDQRKRRRDSYGSGGRGGYDDRRRGGGGRDKSPARDHRPREQEEQLRGLRRVQ